MIGANAPVNLYMFPLYLKTNPSLGTIELDPPIASNFSICIFNLFNFSTLSGFCKSFNALSTSYLIFLTAASGDTAKNPDIFFNISAPT